MSDLLYAIEATDDNGDPFWKCPVCPFSDARYFIGGRGAVGYHIHTEHPERAPK